MVLQVDVVVLVLQVRGLFALVLQVDVVDDVGMLVLQVDVVVSVIVSMVLLIILIIKEWNIYCTALPYDLIL